MRGGSVDALVYEHRPTVVFAGLRRKVLSERLVGGPGPVARHAPIERALSGVEAGQAECLGDHAGGDEFTNFVIAADG